MWHGYNLCYACDDGEFLMMMVSRMFQSRFIQDSSLDQMRDLKKLELGAGLDEQHEGSEQEELPEEATIFNILRSMCNNHNIL